MKIQENTAIPVRPIFSLSNFYRSKTTRIDESKRPSLFSINSTRTTEIRNSFPNGRARIKNPGQTTAASSVHRRYIYSRKDNIGLRPGNIESCNCIALYVRFIVGKGGIDSVALRKTSSVVQLGGKSRRVSRGIESNRVL